jgi:hypothetical protein
VVVAGIDLGLAPFDLGLGLLLGSLPAVFRRVLQPVRLGVEPFFLAIQRLVEVHAVAHDELAEDGRDGQPVQRLRDDAVPVVAVAEVHPSSSSLLSLRAHISVRHYSSIGGQCIPEAIRITASFRPDVASATSRDVPNGAVFR